MKQAQVDYSALRFKSSKDLSALARDVKSNVTVEPVYIEAFGKRVMKFRCPPGTRRGGKWTDRMGSDCNLGSARAGLAKISKFVGRLDETLAEREARQAAGEPGAIRRGAGKLLERAGTALENFGNRRSGVPVSELADRSTEELVDMTRAVPRPTKRRRPSTKPDQPNKPFDQDSDLKPLPPPQGSPQPTPEPTLTPSAVSPPDDAPSAPEPDETPKKPAGLPAPGPDEKPVSTLTPRDIQMLEASDGEENRFSFVRKDNPNSVGFAYFKSKDFEKVIADAADGKIYHNGELLTVEQAVDMRNAWLKANPDYAEKLKPKKPKKQFLPAPSAENNAKKPKPEPSDKTPGELPAPAPVDVPIEPSAIKPPEGVQDNPATHFVELTMKAMSEEAEDEFVFLAQDDIAYSISANDDESNWNDLKNAQDGLVFHNGEKISIDEALKKREEMLAAKKPLDEPTAGKVPEPKRTVLEVPEDAKPPSGPAKAAEAAVDEAAKKNAKKKGNIPGKQYGTAFSVEKNAKKYAASTALDYEKDIYVVKRPDGKLLLVDEERYKALGHPAIYAVNKDGGIIDLDPEIQDSPEAVVAEVAFQESIAVEDAVEEANQIAVAAENQTLDLVKSKTGQFLPDDFGPTDLGYGSGAFVGETQQMAAFLDAWDEQSQQVLDFWESRGVTANDPMDMLAKIDKYIAERKEKKDNPGKIGVLTAERNNFLAMHVPDPGEETVSAYERINYVGPKRRSQIIADAGLEEHLVGKKQVKKEVKDLAPEEPKSEPSYTITAQTYSTEYGTWDTMAKGTSEFIAKNEAEIAKQKERLEGILRKENFAAIGLSDDEWSQAVKQRVDAFDAALTTINDRLSAGDEPTGKEWEQLGLAAADVQAINAVASDFHTALNEKNLKVLNADDPELEALLLDEEALAALKADHDKAIAKHLADYQNWKQGLHPTVKQMMEDNATASLPTPPDFDSQDAIDAWFDAQIVEADAKAAKEKQFVEDLVKAGVHPSYDYQFAAYDAADVVKAHWEEKRAAAHAEFDSKQKAKAQADKAQHTIMAKEYSESNPKAVYIATSKNVTAVADSEMLEYDLNAAGADAVIFVNGKAVTPDVAFAHLAGDAPSADSATPNDNPSILSVDDGSTFAEASKGVIDQIGVWNEATGTIHTYDLTTPDANKEEYEFTMSDLQEYLDDPTTKYYHDGKQITAEAAQAMMKDGLMTVPYPSSSPESTAQKAALEEAEKAAEEAMQMPVTPTPEGLGNAIGLNALFDNIAGFDMSMITSAEGAKLGTTLESIQQRLAAKQKYSTKIDEVLANLPEGFTSMSPQEQIAAIRTAAGLSSDLAAAKEIARSTFHNQYGRLDSLKALSEMLDVHSGNKALPASSTIAKFDKEIKAHAEALHVAQGNLAALPTGTHEAVRLHYVGQVNDARMKLLAAAIGKHNATLKKDPSNTAALSETGKAIGTLTSQLPDGMRTGIEKRLNNGISVSNAAPDGLSAKGTIKTSEFDSSLLGTVQDGGKAIAHAIPVGHKGLWEQGDADQHLATGGKMSDVPDAYLATAIRSNLGANKRFQPINGATKGYNETIQFVDTATGNRYVIKAAHRNHMEHIQEVAGARLAQIVGDPSVGIRFGSDVYADSNLPGPQKAAEGVKEGLQRQIVIDAVHNMFKGQNYKVYDSLHDVPAGAKFDGASLARMMVLDRTMNYFDRTGANMVVVGGPDGKIHLLPIDHGNAFRGFEGGKEETFGFIKKTKGDNVDLAALVKKLSPEERQAWGEALTDGVRRYKKADFGQAFGEIADTMKVNDAERMRLLDHASYLEKRKTSLDWDKMSRAALLHAGFSDKEVEDLLNPPKPSSAYHRSDKVDVPQQALTVGTKLAKAVEDAPPLRLAHQFVYDGDDIRHLQVRARQISYSSSKFGGNGPATMLEFKRHGKATDFNPWNEVDKDGWTLVSSGHVVPKAASATENPLFAMDGSSGTMHTPGTAGMSVWGKKLDDGTIVLVTTGNQKNSTDQTVRIVMPGQAIDNLADDAKIEQAMKAVGVKSYGLPTQADVEKFALQSATRLLTGKKGQFTVPTLEKKLQESHGIGLKNLRTVIRPDGTLDIEFDDEALKKILADAKNVKTIHHSFSYGGGGQTAVVNALIDGRISPTTRRFNHGVPVGGGSSSSDVGSHGSGDYLFTYKNYYTTPAQFGTSANWSFVTPAEVAYRRTTWFALNGDHYGEINHNKGVALGHDGSSSMEVMFDGGLDVTRGLIVVPDADYAQVLAKVKAAGVEDIHGVPIEDILVTKNTYAQAYAKLKERLAEEGISIA